VAFDRKDREECKIAKKSGERFSLRSSRLFSAHFAVKGFFAHDSSILRAT